MPAQQSEIMAVPNGDMAEVQMVPQAVSNGTTSEHPIEGQSAPNANTSESVPVDQSVSKGSHEGFEDIEWLDLSKTAVVKKKTKLLARAMEDDLLKNLKGLFLEGNAGDLGVRATFNALRNGHLKGLNQLILWEVSSYDQISPGEEGTETIADAMADGNMPNLETLDLRGSLPKLIPARPFTTTMKKLLFSCSCGNARLLEGCRICMGCLICCRISSGKKNQALECLRCICGNLQLYIGDDGITIIMSALRVTALKEVPQPMRVLNLQDNYIHDEGASSIARILRENVLPNLEKLDLRNNPVGHEGVKKIVHAFLRNPLLTVHVRLDWPNELLRQTAVTYRDNNIRLEHKLGMLGIPATDESVVVNEYIQLQHYLLKPRGKFFQNPNYRLHLRCQGKDENGTWFKGVRGKDEILDHQVTGEKGDAAPGIEIIQSFFFSSSQSNVQRVLEPTGGGEGQADDNGVSKFENEGTRDDTLCGGSLRGKRNISSEPAHLLSTLKLPSFRRTTGVNRIYIRSNTFLGGAARSRLCSWAGFQSEETRQQMNAITEELLMLGERKPNEFYNLFGLRQVLLENPRRQNKYSRIWICKSCFEHFGKGTNKGMKPITTDADLNPKSGGRFNRKLGDS